MFLCHLPRVYLGVAHCPSGRCRPSSVLQAHALTTSVSTTLASQDWLTLSS